MLVILSDLHFCDQTSVERNYDVADFKSMMTDLYELADQYHVPGKDCQIDIVLLGDIFDLLRTELWFEVPVEHRPWGSAAVLGTTQHSDETLQHARTIAAEIIRRNEDIFQVLRGEVSPPPSGYHIRRLYIPGNHDRLFLHDRPLRDLMRKALGTVDAVDDISLNDEGLYRHRLVLPRYNLLCRHGHEWDGWNFAAYSHDRTPADYSDDEYLLTPIGDLITTELVARLPHQLHRHLLDSGAFEGEEGTRRLQQIRARMQCIEDVRPLMAAFYWVSYEAQRLHRSLKTVAQADALEKALSKSIVEIARDFKQLEFYREWRGRDGHAGKAAKLGVVLEACSLFSWVRIQDLAWAFSTADEALDLFEKDPVGQGAGSEVPIGTSGLRFVVYGHTHEPLQGALRVGESTEDMYLNSGTWRRRHHATADRRGFIGWQHFSYMIFYDEEEMAAHRRSNSTTVQDRRGVGFEYWNGARLPGVPG